MDVCQCISFTPQKSILILAYVQDVYNNSLFTPGSDSCYYKSISCDEVVSVYHCYILVLCGSCANDGAV